jgi:ketosteroid isomerase-like protein
MWSRRDPVTLFGAAGMFESGWEQLSETFQCVASRFSNVSDYRFEVLAADLVGDMAYTVGYERFIGSIDGRPVAATTVRSTHIYRREEGEWKIVHLTPVPGRWVMGLTSARAEGREDCLMLCAIGTGGGRSEITPCWVWVLRLSAEERKVPFPVVRGEG